MAEKRQLKQVRVGVDFFIVREDGKFLMTERIGSHGENTYQLAGEHLEFGETLGECALRETKKECGLDVINPVLIATTEDYFEKEEKHYITCFMKTKYIGGEPEVLEPHKTKDWWWVSWDKLPKNSFLPLLNLKKSGFTLI